MKVQTPIPVVDPALSVASVKNMTDAELLELVSKLSAISSAGGGARKKRAMEKTTTLGGLKPQSGPQEED